MDRMNLKSQLILKSELLGITIDREGNLYIKGILKNCSLNSYGYKKISVRFGGSSSVHLLLHRLQAFKKYGDIIFDKGIVVRHLDNNKLNNSWDNICVGTQKQNIQDNLPTKRSNWASHPKFKHSDVISDRQKGLTYSDIMEKYGIRSKGTVSFILNKSMASQS